MKRLALLALLTPFVAGCWTTSSPSTEANPSPPVAASNEVAIELSAVTLGDDCGDQGRVPPPPPSKILAQATTAAPAPSRVAPSQPPADSPAVMAPCPIGATNCGHGFRMGCDQTSMQLAINSTGGTKPTIVKVKTVELLDDAGKVLAVLTARNPSRWSGDAYIVWDEAVAPNQRLAASYLLSAPDWNTLTSGRWQAHNKTFQLRVTLTINDTDRTFEKQSITPAMLEPPVPT